MSEQEQEQFTYIPLVQHDDIDESQQDIDESQHNKSQQDIDESQHDVDEHTTDQQITPKWSNTLILYIHISSKMQLFIKYNGETKNYEVFVKTHHEEASSIARYYTFYVSMKNYVALYYFITHAMEGLHKYTTVLYGYDESHMLFDIADNHLTFDMFDQYLTIDNCVNTHTTYCTTFYDTTLLGWLSMLALGYDVEI